MNSHLIIRTCRHILPDGWVPHPFPGFGKGWESSSPAFTETTRAPSARQTFERESFFRPAPLPS
jgi:hypothetical protein